MSREYNQSYNFFQGMSDDDVLRYQKDALTGHRPTWKMGTGNKTDPGRFYTESAIDPFSMFREMGGHGRADQIAGQARNPHDPQCRAQGIQYARARARARREPRSRRNSMTLVKRHHPDANGGDRSTEDRLVEIIQAYNYLKSSRLLLTRLIPAGR